MIESNVQGIKTYIIGLEESYRGVSLENQLSEHGVEFEWVRGVVGEFEGKTVSSFVDQSGVSRVIGRSLSDGEIGCALAHLSVYQRIAADAQADWAIVLEDDSRLIQTKELTTLVASMEQFDRNTPTVICLYAMSVLTGKKILELGGSLSISELLLTPSSNSAYLINKSAARLFLRDGLPLVSPADWPQRTEGKIRFLLAFPFIFRNDLEDVESIIGERGFPVQNERRVLQTLARLASKITGIDWIRHRETWGSFRSYWRSNIVRPVITKAVGEQLTLFVPVSGEPAQASRGLQLLARAIGGGCIRRS